MVFGLRLYSSFGQAMTFLIRILLSSVMLVLLLTVAAVAQTASVSVREPDFDFGKVVRGAVVEHTFTLSNESGSPVGIEKVRLTPPLLPSDIPSLIPAHQEAVLRIKLDTKTLDGPFDGVVLLSLSDAKAPEIRLAITGRVVLPIEAAPPAIFAAAERGEKKDASIEIVNHEPQAVLIEAARHSQERFTTRLETLEEGRRFRLTLMLNPDGPVGRNRETIVLRTSSPAVPELRIVAFTYLRERVYTFPDVVELGVLRVQDIERNPDLLKSTAQILMVYRKGTPDFQAKVSTDVPGLTLSAERGPLGDRYQITVSLKPDTIRPGKMSGSIFIETNDSEFPKLTVPVSGQILGPTPGGG